MCATTTDKPTTQHPFERAGLGVAPFRFQCVTTNTFQACPGAPIQPGGCCDYCSNGIMFEYWITDATGKRFKVGSDCVAKIYRADNAKTDPVYVAIHDARRKVERDKRHEREKQQLADGLAWLKAHSAELAKLPHPFEAYAKQGKNLRDSLRNRWEQSGTSGKLAVIRDAKRALEKKS